MEPISLELKVMSGKDLRAFNFFQRLTLYVLASIISDDPKTELDQKTKQQPQRTPTDRDGDGDGSDPEWNHEMRFDLRWVSFEDCDNLFLHLELRHEGLMFGDKTIGEVRVPLKDLIREGNGIVRFVTYEVRTGDGKPNGVVNFSYKVDAKIQWVLLGSGITGYTAPEAHEHPNQPERIQYPTLEPESLSSPGIIYPAIDPISLPAGNQTPTDVQPGTSPSPKKFYYCYPPPPPPPPPSSSFPPSSPPGAPPFYPPPPPHNPFHHPPPAGSYHQPFRPRIYPWTSDPNNKQNWRW